MCVQNITPFGCPASWPKNRKRGRVDRCFHILRQFEGGRSEFWDIFTGDETFVYQYVTETRTAVLSMAFSRWETSCEIQDTEKHLQTDRRSILRKIQSRDYCPAAGEVVSQCGEVHQYLLAHGLRVALCDFFLFPQMKWQLKKKQFQGTNDARAFFEGMISDIRQSKWSGTMVAWFEGMTKCVYVEGGYNWKKEEEKKAGLSKKSVRTTRSPHPETYAAALVCMRAVTWPTCYGPYRHR